MNSDDRFIQQLERYLDDYEGATILPERVRDEVRAVLPRTKQTGAARGPVRYLSMTMTKLGPVALAAAAALLAAAVGIYAFANRNVGDTTPTPSPSASSAPSASAAACTRTSMTWFDRRVSVDWCSQRADGPPVPIAFSMEGPAEWTDLYFSDRNALWVRPPDGGALLFSVHPEQTVIELLEDVRGREGYALSSEADVDLDGAAGVVFDLTLADGASAAETDPLFANSEQRWLLSEGTHRVWIVDHDGETIMIAAGEELADAVTDAMPTLTWGD